MPLYRFQTNAGPTDLHNIIAKVELPSLEAAKIQAVRYLGELLKDDGPEFWIEESAVLSVSEDDGDVLFTLALALV